MNYPPQGPPPQGPPPQGPPPGNYGPPQGNPGQWGPPPQQPPWPQQQWSPGPPPKKRNGWKWALGAVALLAVVGVTAAVTISVTSGDGGGDDPAPSGETYGLASADDTGPVNIITEDPSCAAWGPINDTFVDVQDKGWSELDRSIPSAEWTQDYRIHFEEVAVAARAAAEQTVPVAKLTPHRVMRELYEQFIAYARAYSDAISSYEPSDDHLAKTLTNSAATLIYVCSAITYGSAQARAALVTPAGRSDEVAPLEDPAKSERFVHSPEPVCSEWYRLIDQFAAETRAWQALDPAIPASARTPEQQATIENVIPVMIAFADDIQELGAKSNNPVLRDFADLAAEYRRGYAGALSTYTSADSYLSSTSARAAALVYQACKSADA